LLSRQQLSGYRTFWRASAASGGGYANQKVRSEIS
jgi:hypothetical protein